MNVNGGNDWLKRICAVALATAGLLVCIAIASAAPSSKTQQALQQATRNLDTFRLQITLFDHDAAQRDRSVDIEVTDEDTANAEGLMSRAQASRVLDVLASVGFFDRAREMGSAKWDPPPQPFYIVWVRYSDSPGVYEFRTGDASLMDLLVQVRDALAKGLAARSVDRAVAALDPQRRRWPPLQDAHPSPPALPPGASPLHPGHVFRAIDSSWKVREVYLKPFHGTFTSSAVADETTLADYKDWFRELTYSESGGEVRKRVTLYPAGAIYSEVDSDAYGVDVPRGDIYERLFKSDGTILLYSHVKDGKTVDASSFDVHGKIATAIAGGKGFLQRPTFDPDVRSDDWFYEGWILLETKFEKNNWFGRTLNDNTESGHASLALVPDGSQVLWQDGFQWVRRTDGKVERKQLYATDAESRTDSQLQDDYAAARRKFMGRFTARAAAAGFSLKAMGLSE